MASDIGPVRRIKLWHDNSGLGPAWHVTLVTVYSSASNATYSFPCNAWLIKDKTHPEGNARELLEGGDASGDACFTLHVFTSNIRGAGTDGEVTATIYGESGDTGATFSVCAIRSKMLLHVCWTSFCQ